jgi:VanZ family protein
MERSGRQYRLADDANQGDCVMATGLLRPDFVGTRNDEKRQAVTLRRARNYDPLEQDALSQIAGHCERVPLSRGSEGTSEAVPFPSQMSFQTDSTVRAFSTYGQSMTLTKFLKYWFPVVLCIGFIYWMSTGMFSAHNTYFFLEPVVRFFFPSISHRRIVMIHNLARKAAHVTEYFAIGLLLFRAFRSGSNDRRYLSWAFSSIVVIALLAAADEYHQSGVATRTASVMDVGIDTTGGILAQCASVLWNYLRRKNPS